ncbi:MAG: ATP-binding protein [Alphaproteobacteria bacterium]|nr:ATP-binding protein [Alphaproteobacteria bacterium]
MSIAATTADPTDAPVHESLDIVMRDTMRSAKRGFLFRLVPGVLTALLSMYWLGWQYPFFIIAALVAHELVVFPLIYRKVVRPNIEKNPLLATGVISILLAIGGVIYGLGWIPLMYEGTVTGVYIAAAWLWGTIVHNLTYFSRTRMAFFATCAPQILGVVVAPFVMDVGVIAPWLMLYLTLQTLATVLFAARDRQSLADHAREDRAARQLAETANVQKSQFLTTMSHELRTPLNAIIGYAEILEEDLEAAPEEANADDARRIRRAARHLLLLINEVLDLSKIEAGRLELIDGPVDVAALLREVEETVRPIGAGNGNKVVLDIVGRIPTLETDGARLKQCLLNLATNACKFTKDGRVTIRAAIETRGGASVLEVAVVDSGIGISHEDQARLFQPFVQVDSAETRKQDGTGLGLVITHKLAQAMGGDVSLVSTPGLGSTFTLTIAATPAAQSAGENINAGPVVLVIEDDPTARDLTVRALSRLSFNVRSATNAAEGLAMIEASAPDLVILDIHLPDMSGWDVLARIKTGVQTSVLPVLVVTIDDDRARALDLGACDHMQKPVDRDRLTAAAVRFALPHQPRAAASAVIPTADAQRFG